MHNTNNQIKFKTSMLKSSLYDYSDTYILLSETITVVAAVAENAAIDTDKNNKQYSHMYWKYLDIYISFAEICQIML